MATILLPTKCNLFCGDDQEGKHLALEHIKWPQLSEKVVEHHGGGTFHPIDIPVGGEKLEFSFKLKGFDPDMMKKFGLGSPDRLNYTAYQVIQDYATGAKMEYKAILYGRLIKYDQGDVKPNEASDADYVISSITRYEVYYDGREMFYYEWQTQTRRINGIDQDAAAKQILRIPTTRGNAG
jgi:uncharacterized protein